MTMTKEQCITDLKGSMELYLFDPSTGEVIQPEHLNDISRMTYEAMKAAVAFLEETEEEKTQGMIPIDSYYVELWLKSEIEAAEEREKNAMDMMIGTAAGAQKAALRRVLEKVERWKGKTGLYEV